MTPTETPRFADVLTAAIQGRGLSLERIRARLHSAGVPVSIATLSYWQSGRSLPTRSRSYHTLVELEKILNVEPGFLTQHTHTADGRTRRELFEWQSVLPVRDLATQVIEDLGIDMQGQLTRVMQFDLVTIKGDRTEATQDCRVVWRAERQGLHRWPVVVEQDADPESDRDAVATIEALFGCDVGEVVEVSERHLVVAEMIAARPLQRGELLSAEYRITYAPTTLPSFRLSRSLSDPVRMLGLGARFAASAVPARVFAGATASMDEAFVPDTPVPVARHEAQWLWTDVRPGVYALHWEWT